MALGTFDPQLLQRSIESNPAQAFRDLADCIDRKELDAFLALVQGNGMMASQHGRVVFDVRFRIEVPVHREVDDAAHMVGGGR